MVLAYLSKEDDGETIHVHDYARSATSGMDTVYTISKPFSAGYKVGGLQLDSLGHRIVVVSADGRFIYLYCLSEEITDSQGEVSQD